MTCCLPSAITPSHSGDNLSHHQEKRWNKEHRQERQRCVEKLSPVPRRGFPQVDREDAGHSRRGRGPCRPGRSRPRGRAVPVEAGHRIIQAGPEDEQGIHDVDRQEEEDAHTRGTVENPQPVALFPR